MAKMEHKVHKIHRVRRVHLECGQLRLQFAQMALKMGLLQLADLFVKLIHLPRAPAFVHKAFGAVVGKALAPFTDGTGLIPVLVALQ